MELPPAEPLSRLLYAQLVPHFPNTWDKGNTLDDLGAIVFRGNRTAQADDPIADFNKDIL